MAATDLISLGIGGSTAAPVAYFTTFGLGDYGGVAPAPTPARVESNGGGKRKRRQEDVLSPEELRAIWRGEVYAPPPPVVQADERPTDRPAPRVATEAVEATRQQIVRLREEAVELGLYVDITADLARLLEARQATDLFVAEVERRIRRERDEQDALLLMLMA